MAVYDILQTVHIVDMNHEPLTHTTFSHGTHQLIGISVGSSILTKKLGLRQFEVVFDTRFSDVDRFKVVDIEYDISQDEDVFARVIIEPITLIVGQHDVGASE